MKVLALDFDGVISDSAAESFAVALRTYVQLRPDSRLDELAREIAASSPGALRANRVYRDFLELMPLGNRAEDFAVALDIIESGAAVSTQADYDARFEAWPTSDRDAFHERFYQERQRLSEADRAGWLALLDPYPAIIDLLWRRAPDVTLALATAKDHRTVKILLERYGLSPLLPDERILDKESGPSKRAHLAALSHRLDVDYAEITFMDDKVNHLEGVASLGVRCVLAGWGYNGQRERTRAEEQGFLVCDLSDVERTLFGDA
jgi:phosphoglycolate phosphatase-like HAD superfamily hydrolase